MARYRVWFRSPGERYWHFAFSCSSVEEGYAWAEVNNDNHSGRFEYCVSPADGMSPNEGAC